MNKFIEIAGRIGSQRHLLAVRDGFIAIMPLIIIGSFAVLVNNFPPIGSFDFVELMTKTFGEGWITVGGSIWNGTFAILGLLIAFSIAYQLARSYDVEGLPAGFIAAAGYIALAPETPNDWGLDFAWLGTQGIFIAIILAIVVGELYRVLVKSKFTIKMPDGVPGGVERSFRALIPTIIIMTLIGLFQTFMNAVSDVSVFELVFEAIQAPLQSLSSTLPAALVVAFLNQLLWFFGLHGTNILGAIIEPIYIPLVIENGDLFKNGMSAFEVPHIVTKPFLDSFVFLGGSGATISLLAAIFIVIRREKKHPYREVAKVSAPASIFNINEPVIFGLPIVLNPVMLVPFIVIPVLLTIISYFALATGLVPRTVALVPWSTPPILSGFLVTGGSWRGIALQIFNIVLATLIYIPFVIAGVRAMRKQMEEAEEEQ
ncbi:MAG TPA: PTS sugar transporter subunit IIC [Pseudogracilibacillus sp.]|nr:PTS sugar transporter subunit IIC [Pseudogracilibacillus sp.]